LDSEPIFETKVFNLIPSKRIFGTNLNVEPDSVSNRFLHFAPQIDQFFGQRCLAKTERSLNAVASMLNEPVLDDLQLILQCGPNHCQDESVAGLSLSQSRTGKGSKCRPGRLIPFS
jgi:hypothetical protein